jgi:lipopolysaccharide export system permease protein
MRLLDRYLLRELLSPLGYCLGGFLVFWTSFDLLGELEDFQRRQLLARDVAEYYLVKAPETLVTVAPLALLLALLYALTNHARHQELTAMRAAGQSLWRLCLPYLLVGWALALGLFALNEYGVPDSNAAAERILVRRQSDRASQADPDLAPNLTFYNERDGRKWNIAAYNQKTGLMLKPIVQWRLRDGSTRWISAAQGVYSNRVWVFSGVKELLYPPQANALPLRTETNELVLAELTETPAQIKSEIKFAALSNIKAAKRPRLSLRELLDYQRLHPQLNWHDRAKLQTQFHGRLAEPWTCLVVVLIAIPFGASSGRRNVFVGVASSIFIAFAYFIMLRFGLALGTGGYLEPWAAAWLPNLLFALAGIWLTQRVR